jgi:hypothetical protein
VLGKLIKHDFKTQWQFFAILFGAVIAVPMLVFLVTINADSADRGILRNLVAGFAVVASIVLTLIFAAKPFERDFNENGAYLMQTIPVKVSDLIISKAILYYIWVVLSGIAAVVAVGASMMDFTYLGGVIDYLFDVVFSSDLPNDISVQIYIGMGIFSSLIQPLGLFGFIIAAMATGHLAGTHKRLGEGLFIVCFLIVMFTYSGFMMAFSVASILPTGDISGQTLYMVGSTLISLSNLP